MGDAQRAEWGLNLRRGDERRLFQMQGSNWQDTREERKTARSWLCAGIHQRGFVATNAPELTAIPLDE
jgi:hypothetical protein